MKHLEVEAMPLGALQTNCYLIYDPETKEALLVDPGDEAARLLTRIEELNLQLQAIWLTHTHGDHIGAVGELVAATGVPIAVHPNESEWLADPERNLSGLIGMPVTTPPPTCLFSPGEPEEMLGRTWQILFTPGHTPGGVSFYTEDFVITGDALFAGSVGRTDLPGSETEVLLDGIRENLYTLPDETRVYPGHGGPTTIGAEKNGNPFVRG